MSDHAAEQQPLDRQTDTDDTSFDDAFAEYSNRGRGDRDEYHRDAPEPDEDQAPEPDHGKDDEAPAELSEGDEAQASDDDLKARLQQLEHSERSQRGRVGALSRQLQERDRIIAELKGRQAAPQPTPSKTGESKDVQDQKQAIADEHGVDDWDAFRNDFPDIAKALDSRFEHMSRMEERINSRLEEVNGAIQPIQQQAHEQHLAGQFAALEARHADWREVVSAPAFQQWLEQQPEWMQKQVESENADDASALLDIYKGLHPPPGESRNDTREQRNNRLAQAQTVSRRGSPRPSGAPDDFEGAFNHFASKRNR
ncbi:MULTISPECIES: hypothetical protein [Halomonadaceae]|uniref:hypothetical protein n=1 Tax=Halomonadaceae TaxID=28256 RepID=UPI00159A8701|nr:MULTISPECIES: hypothetical protein [Halomonas]QJQ93918.1 hypothetical protein HIO72_00480 [Halomonas sp. PA5]